MPERYLTQDLPGIGGTIKDQVEDFLVEEIPLYPPSGTGQHTFFEIRKQGIPTFHVVRLIAGALAVPPRSIGYAGLKDAQAVTTQVLSVERVDPETVLALDLPNIRVIWAERHEKRLKIGHLRGNRFTIRVRGVDKAALDISRAILQVLETRGVPNRYGPQRFGQRGDSALLGRAVVRRDAEGFTKAFLGNPHPNESEGVRSAREHYEAGDWDAALRRFPGNMADERRALEVLIRTGGDYGRAYRSVPKRLKMFLLSALQSELFNQVLDARLDTLDQVFAGDIAMKHPGRSVFRVEDETVEQPRATRFEISATGPVFGFKMMQAQERQGRVEAEILAAEGFTLADFAVGEGIKAKGERRALRFQMADPDLWFDDGIMLRFELPRGCYATTVLSEFMKAS